MSVGSFYEVQLCQSRVRVSSETAHCFKRLLLMTQVCFYTDLDFFVWLRLSVQGSGWGIFKTFLNVYLNTLTFNFKFLLYCLKIYLNGSKL